MRLYYAQNYGRCLDAIIMAESQSQALSVLEKEHPSNEWQIIREIVKTEPIVLVVKTYV